MFADDTAQFSPRMQADKSIPGVLTDPHGSALLAQVMARLPRVARPVVQVVAASPRCTTGRVAYALAAEAAAHLGVVLLVCDGGAVVNDASGARQMAARMTRLLGGQAGAVLPDGGVAGLYHTGNESVRGAAPIEAWLEDERAFRMIVLDMPCFAASARSLATAMLCDGCLLTVAAGVTRPADVRATLRQVSGTSVPLLGTVLHEAPRIRVKRWFSGR
jgi:hypothetical protein